MSINKVRPKDLDNSLTSADLASGDIFIVEDISANELKKITKAEMATAFGGGGGSDAAAIHDDTAGEINAITEKVTLADADEFLIEDSAASYAKKKTLWSTIKSVFKTYYDSVAATLTQKTIDADNNTITNIGTSELSDEGVTLAKMAHIATNRILGRETAGTGDVEALTATQVRTIINVENGADVTDSVNVEASGALMDSEVTDLAGIKALQTSTLQLKPLEGAFVDGDKTKLDGIATGAQVNTVDSVNTQTGAVVLDADDISDAATTNKFTTAADISKLAGIETGADVTDTANVTAAGALMDSEVTDLAGIKALDTSTLQVKPSEGAFVDGDKTKLDGIETGADVTDEANVVSALSGATLSDAGTPQATDKVLVQDASDSDNLKYVDFSDFSSGTTVDVVSNVAADRILGRVTAGSGDSEELTAAQVRTLINVEDGADVTDSTNVDAAGAVMNADTSTAAMSFVVDEDNMVSDLATKVPTQQSVKAYVDTGLSGKQDTITNSDSITEGSTNLFMTTSERSKLSGIETGADVTDATNIGTAISNATGKSTPVDADVFSLLDSAASFVLKKITWSEIKSAIKSYYDAVTATLTNKTLTDAVNSVSTPTTTSVGYLGVPQESKSANYTLVLADAGKHIYHPASDANDRTFTIPANASVAYPIGTTVTFVNLSANTVTIAITTDTMNLIGAGTTGSRALAQYGMATALKVASTTWVINGTNLT